MIVEYGVTEDIVSWIALVRSVSWNFPLFVYLRTEFPRSAILAMDFSSMRVFFE